MPLSTYLHKWQNVPAPVKQFVLRALAILVVWKVLYLAVLLPTRVLDRPLSSAVASGATWMLNAVSHSSNYTSKTESGDVLTENGLVNMPLVNIYFHSRNIVSIEDTCNALELFILYAGFIVCMPATLRTKIFFIIGGILLIHFVNMFRCAGIAYMIQYYPKQAVFAHHYIFTFIVYGLIIALWLIFSKKIRLPNAQTEH